MKLYQLTAYMKHPACPTLVEQEIIHNNTGNVVLMLLDSATWSDDMSDQPCCSKVHGARYAAMQNS